MMLVFLESPLSGDVVRNIAYARACMRDSLSRGEAPLAAHLLYAQPGILDDTDPEQRELGMSAGFAWAMCAESTVVYSDLGISGGMREGIGRALEAGRRVERRLIGWSP